MPKKTPEPDRRDEVKDLIAELDQLASELGVTPEPLPRRPPARTRKATTSLAPKKPSPAPETAGPWWDYEPGEVIDVPAISLPPLPSDKESEPDIEMRPWSPAAARAPVAPPPPRQEPAPVAVDNVAKPAPQVEERASRSMTVLAVGGVLVAGIVYLLATRIDLVSTSGPATLQQSAPLTLAGLRTTASTSVDGAETAPTQSRFPAGTTAVVVDALVTGTTPGDDLEYRVEQTSPGVPAKLVSDRVRPVSTTASLHVEYAVTASGAFASGEYTVTVFHGDRELGSITFTIGSPASPGAATATPSG
jgi:hypothetical protein